MGDVFSWPVLNQSAQAELAEIREQARSEGHLQGLREGRAAAEAEVAVLKQTLADAIESLAESRERLTAADAALLASQLAELARALLGAELETNPRIIENLLAEALAGVAAGRDALTVRISPQDAVWVGHPDGIAVELDPDQRPGSVVVEAPEADIVFDPMARLAELLASAEREEHAGADAAVPPTH